MTSSLTARIFSVAAALLLARAAQAQDAAPATDGGVADAASPTPQPSPSPSPPPSPVAEPVHAHAHEPVEKNTLRAPRVDVIGRAPRALSYIPGTAQVIRREEIRQMAPQSAAEALRSIPGINVASEDAMGLRANIGIRGLDPNRSRKVLVLEDGMPISLNPYGGPELYYTPPIERMDHVEVVKGSGQILWGPQTIGGVINYITRDPPRKLGGNADVRYGSFNYVLAQGGIGATHGPVGWRIDVLHRRFDGPRALNLSLTDATGKLRVQFNTKSSLMVKLNFYNENSSATYLGLTTPQYQTDPTLSLAPHDQFNVRRYAVGITHQHLFSDKLLLQTMLYAYETAREWRRQEFERSDSGAEYERICDAMGRCGPRGASDVTPTNDGGSIFFRKDAALRNRIFHVAGVEPRLTWNWAAKEILTGELTALVRFHYERARDQIMVASFPTAFAGDIRDDEIRNGYAIAAAIQNRFSIWKRLHITPGLRIENFFQDRRVIRVTDTRPDGTLYGTDVNNFGRSFSYALIPGLGISADVIGPLQLYTGVHRGYAPPRTKDAVAPSGANLNLAPELSWNVELGARVALGQWLSIDVAGFHMEFENQIIPPSESGGATALDFNAGHSRHSGLEASVNFDIASLLKQRSFALPLLVNYTYLPLASFVDGLYDGNRLPYAPEHLLYTQLRFQHRVGASVQLGLTYVGAQFADKENTPFASRDGIVGTLPGYALLDARVAYTFKRQGVTLYVAGKNLTNQIYIANRAPSGIQPAGFLQVFGGIEYQTPTR